MFFRDKKILSTLDMARMMAEMERWEDAAAECLKAYDLAVREWGQYSEQTFEVLDELVSYQARIGDPESGEPYTHALVEMATMLFAPDDDRVAGALYNHATVLMLLGRAEEAEQHIDRLLSVDPATSEGWAALSFMALALLGSMMVDDGRHDEGIAVLERALGLIQAGLVDLDEDAIDVWIDISRAHQFAGRPGAAEQVLRDADGDLADAGATLLDRAPILNRLAGVLGELERYDEAVSIQMSVIEQIENDQDSAERLPVVYGNLAGLLEQSGEAERAQSAWERAVQIGREQWGDGDPELAELLGEYALSLFDRGDLDLSVEATRESIAIWEASEHDPIRLSGGYHQLAGTLRARGELDSSEEAYRSSIAILERLEDVDDALAVQLANLGALLLDMNRDDESREVLERSVALARVAFADDPSELATPLQRLADALPEQDNELAERLYREALDAIAHAGTTYSLDGMNALRGLGATLIDDRPDEAVGVLEQAFEIAQTIGEGDEELSVGHAMLAAAHRACVDLDAAIEHQRAAAVLLEGIDDEFARVQAAVATARLADFLLDADRETEALECARHANALLGTTNAEPEEVAWVRDSLGSALIVAGALDEARQLFEDMQGLVEDLDWRPKASVSMALSRIAADQGRYDEALGLALECESLMAQQLGADDEDLAFAHRRIAEACGGLGRCDEAREHVSRARKLAASLDTREPAVARLHASLEAVERECLSD